MSISNRRQQRLAKDLADEAGIPYQQALQKVRQCSNRCYESTKPASGCECACGGLLHGKGAQTVPATDATGRVVPGARPAPPLERFDGESRLDQALQAALDRHGENAEIIKDKASGTEDTEAWAEIVIQDGEEWFFYRVDYSLGLEEPEIEMLERGTDDPSAFADSDDGRDRRRPDRLPGGRRVTARIRTSDHAREAEFDALSALRRMDPAYMDRLAAEGADAANRPEGAALAAAIIEAEDFRNPDVDEIFEYVMPHDDAEVPGVEIEVELDTGALRAWLEEEYRPALAEGLREPPGPRHPRTVRQADAREIIPTGHADDRARLPGPDGGEAILAGRLVATRPEPLRDALTVEEWPNAERARMRYDHLLAHASKETRAWVAENPGWLA